MFPVLNVIPGFVSIKIETMLIVIVDARKMLQMFKTKSTLFKVNNRNTTTRYKICSKLTIKTAEWHQWRRSGVFTVEFEQCHLENIFAYFRSSHQNLFWKIAVLETEFFHRYFSMIFPGFPKHLFCVTDASSASCIYIVIFCHYWSTLRWHRHIFLLCSIVWYSLLFKYWALQKFLNF